MEENRECGVCYATVKAAKGFACPNRTPPEGCPFWTCHGCFKKALPDYGLVCMACMVPLPEDKWYDLFPPTLVNTHVRDTATREQFERVRARLPEVQALAAIEKEIRVDRAAYAEITKRFQEESRKVNAMRKEMNTMQDTIRGKQSRSSALASVALGSARRVPQGTREDAGPAPAVLERCLTAGCYAYMDAQGHCSICEATFCLGCQTPAHGAAACQPDALASVAYIRASSKPCPGCGTPTQRSEGCPQMWCTAPGCCTAWNFTTGKKINGHIHNPHFSDFLRAGGVVPQAPQPLCPGGQPRLQDLSNNAALRATRTDKQGRKLPLIDFLMGFFRRITHLLDVDLNVTDRERTERTAHQKFLTNFLLGSRPGASANTYVPYVQKDLLGDLKRTGKSLTRQTEEQGVLRTCCETALDVFRAYFVQPEAEHNPAALYAQIVELVQLTNQELCKVADRNMNRPTGLFILDESSENHLDYRLHRTLNVKHMHKKTGKAEEAKEARRFTPY